MKKLVLIAAVAFAALPGFSSTNMTPVVVTGFNDDLIVESTASGPPFNTVAQELNPGEGNVFYQHGLPGYANGVPANGSFTNATDGSVFQFQPYTGVNALVLSGDTGVSSGTLTLATTAVFSTLAIVAHSASGDATGSASVTLNFQDGTSFTTTYYAPDWFNNSNPSLYTVALGGVDRINATTGAVSGSGNNNPRFYQTTLNV